MHNLIWLLAAIISSVLVYFFLWHTLAGAFILEVCAALLPHKASEPFDMAHLLLHKESSSRTGWGNLGYWKRASGFEQANLALAVRLAGMLELNSNNYLLDVGSGCGDQLLCWIQRFHVSRIIAINISREQNLFARNKIQEEALNSRIEVIDGSYECILDFKNTEVDRIICLDCIYHFHTRQKFFLLAHDVVLAGGRLAFSDIILQERTFSFLDRLLARMIFTLSSIPFENQVEQKDLRLELINAGFQIDAIEFAEKHVLHGYAEFIRKYYKKYRQEATPRRWLRFLVVGYFLKIAYSRKLFHYVLVSATKKSSES